VANSETQLAPFSNPTVLPSRAGSPAGSGSKLGTPADPHVEAEQLQVVFDFGIHRGAVSMIASLAPARKQKRGAPLSSEIGVTAPIRPVGATIDASRGEDRSPVSGFLTGGIAVRAFAVSLGALCLAMAPAIAQTPARPHSTNIHFRTPNLSMEERVTNIISLLTPEEKVDVLGANYYLGGRGGPVPL